MPVSPCLRGKSYQRVVKRPMFSRLLVDVMTHYEQLVYILKIKSIRIYDIQVPRHSKGSWGISEKHSHQSLPLRATLSTCGDPSWTDIPANVADY